MRVLVIGANGLTGRRVVRLLEDGSHEPVAMIRDPDQAQRFEARGVDHVVADLEEPVDHAMEGVDAVIFAAGSGSGTGLDKTLAVDRDGAVRSLVAAEAAGVARYVMLSSRGADPESDREPLGPYLRAKGWADTWLQRSDLIHTVVRPGRLTREEGTGRIELAPELRRSGTISRADVARVLVSCLDVEATRGETFAILNDGTPIREALEGL